MESGREKQGRAELRVGLAGSLERPHTNTQVNTAHQQRDNNWFMEECSALLPLEDLGASATR